MLWCADVSGAGYRFCKYTLVLLSLISVAVQKVQVYLVLLMLILNLVLMVKEYPGVGDADDISGTIDVEDITCCWRFYAGVGVSALMSMILEMRKVHSGVGNADADFGLDGEVTI